MQLMLTGVLNIHLSLLFTLMFYIHSTMNAYVWLMVHQLGCKCLGSILVAHLLTS